MRHKDPRAGTRRWLRGGVGQVTVVRDLVSVDPQSGRRLSVYSADGLEEIGSIVADPVVANLAVFDARQRNAPEACGRAGSQPGGEVQLKTSGDVVLLDVEQYNGDDALTDREEQRRTDAVAAHIQDIVLEDTDVVKVAIGNWIQRIALGVSGRGIRPDMNATVVINIDGEASYDPPASTTRAALRNPGDAAEGDAVADAAVDLVAPDFDALGSAADLNSRKRRHQTAHHRAQDNVLLNQDVVRLGENRWPGSRTRGIVQRLR